MDANGYLHLKITKVGDKWYSASVKTTQSLGFGTYPKFAKPYADLRATITEAVQAFTRDVAAGRFPDEAHSYR